MGDKDSVFVVAGFPRTGTSMLVHAINDGGIPAHWRPQSPNVRGGHRSQPDDYWQAEKGWWLRNDPAEAAGQVVKFLLFADGLALPVLRRARYRLVVTTRNPEEVQASARAAYGTNSHYSSSRVRRWASVVSRRDDVASVALLDHRTLLTAPEAALSALSWPIDAAAAAAVVDPAWWRFRA